MSTREILLQASAVAINGYALLIEGQPGSGKSTLALELIDRGALLIGDDGVKLSREGETMIARPPPNIAGLIEIRGVGLASIDCVTAPVALGISLVDEAERLPEQIGRRELLGQEIPWLDLPRSARALPLRAEWAMRLHGRLTT